MNHEHAQQKNGGNSTQSKTKWVLIAFLISAEFGAGYPRYSNRTPVYFPRLGTLSSQSHGT